MSRLVMNHLQYEFGLVPVKIVKEDKAEYIQALVDSREQDSLEPFREFMLEEHIRNISKEIVAYKKSQEDDPIKPFSDPIKERLYQAVLRDGTLNYAEYAAIVGTSEAKNHLLALAAPRHKASFLHSVCTSLVIEFN